MIPVYGGIGKDAVRRVQRKSHSGRGYFAQILADKDKDKDGRYIGKRGAQGATR